MSLIPNSTIVDLAFLFPDPFRDFALYLFLTIGLILSIPGIVLSTNIYLAWSSGKEKLKSMLRFKKIQGRDLTLLVLADFFSIGLAIHISFVKFNPSSNIPDILTKFSNNVSSNALISKIILIIILFLLAFLEEFMCRSYFLEKSKEKKLGFTMVIIVSLLFGLWHDAFFPQFFSSLVYAWLFLKYGSLLVTTTFHALFNIIIILVLNKLTINDQPLLEIIGGEYFGAVLVLVGLIPTLVIIRELYQTVGNEDRLVQLIKRPV